VEVTPTKHTCRHSGVLPEGSEQTAQLVICQGTTRSISPPTAACVEGGRGAMTQAT
jgi:hypothetical protein